MNREEVIKTVIEKIKDGGFPSTTGIGITQEEADEIHSLLQEQRKKQAEYFDWYYKNMIATRIIINGTKTKQ